MKLFRLGFSMPLKKNQSSSVVFLKSRTFTYLCCQIKGSATMTSDSYVPSAPSLVQCHAKIHLPVFTQEFHYECDSLGKDVRLLCTLFANKGLQCLWEICFYYFQSLNSKMVSGSNPGNRTREQVQTYELWTWRPSNKGSAVIGPISTTR